MVSRTAKGQEFLDLLHALLSDLIQSNGEKNSLRDFAYAKRRYEEEGFSFLSKALPLLGKAVDLALRTGSFICPTNFRRYKRTALPAFMRGLLCRIFDKNGLLLEEADLCAISELRQVLYLFYKYTRPFSESSLKLAIDKFKSCDANLPVDFQSLSDKTKEVISGARSLLHELFLEFDPQDIVPSHGPGIVASGELPHQKRTFKTKYRRIHEFYPYYRYFYVNPTHLLYDIPSYRNRNTEVAGTNKVLFVPKDSRGPRTIACEPLEYQFIQQGLRRILYEHVERHPLTRGRVNFSDQTINQARCLYASLNPEWITIDLKDASDSVSVFLVHELFSTTNLLGPLMALRTDHSLLPDKTIVKLNKYAAMGSALCFPVEALVFYSLVRSVCALESVSPYCLVYGDDIIVHKDALNTIVQVFKEVGLTVNLDKTCSEGFFRESCGAEYYRGHDVTYLKCKTLDVDQANDLASVVSLSNLFWDRGYYKTSKYLESRARARVPYLPFGRPESPYLCIWTNRFEPPPMKMGSYNRKLQREERRVPVITGINYTELPRSNTEMLGEYFRKVTQGWSPEFVSNRYARRVAKLTYKSVSIHS